MELNFDASDNSKSPSFQSSRDDKSRVSYGGGFHISKKKPEPTPPRGPIASVPAEVANRMSMANGYSSMEVLENEIQRLKFQSQGLENVRQSRQTEGILHLDPPTHTYHSEFEQQKLRGANISLQELEVLKERNAMRLLEIEAELSRSKHEQPPPKNHFGAEYVPVFKKSQPKQNKSIHDYQRKYQEKFDKYLHEKERKRQSSLIKGKEMNVSGNFALEKEDVIENEILLKWMFKKLDKDRSGMVDKVELIQEFTQNPELGKLFGFVERVDSPRYMEKFNQIFESIGLGLKHEISLSEFLTFFEKFLRSSKKAEKFDPKPSKVSTSPKKILKKS